MIPCRIVFSQLPPEVLDAVLRVDEVESNDPRWTLLRSGNTRKIYLFRPHPGKPSWIVKWGCRYHSLKKITEALSGRCQAAVEWEKTRKVEEHQLPIIPFSLLAVPRIRSGRIHSLLVSPFLEKSQSLIQFLQNPEVHSAAVHRTLTRLGKVVYDIHSHNFLHQDLSLDNVLIQDEEPSQLFIIDWFKMKELPEGNTERFGTDLIAPLCDLFYLGTPESAKKAFLEGYAENGIWLKGHFEQILDRARMARIRIIRRAWTNCNRKSRRIIRYRGYQVFLLKGKDRKSVNRSIDTELKSPSTRFRWQFKKENSPALERWRRANALCASGTIRHPVMAYAVQKRWFRIREILVEEPGCEETSLEKFLASESPSNRRMILRQAGAFLKQLHELEMGVRRVSLAQWQVQCSSGGKFEFFTDDLDAILPQQRRTVENRFGWLKNPELESLGIKTLVEFMRGYGKSKEGLSSIREILKDRPPRPAQEK